MTNIRPSADELPVSEHRRRVALRMLRDRRAELFELGHEAAVMYACSILICNEAGWFLLEDVDAAMEDPALRVLAERLVHQANHVR